MIWPGGHCGPGGVLFRVSGFGTGNVIKKLFMNNISNSLRKSGNSDIGL